jgi:hypothetical protein
VCLYICACFSVLRRPLHLCHKYILYLYLYFAGGVEGVILSCASLRPAAASVARGLRRFSSARDPYAHGHPFPQQMYATTILSVRKDGKVVRERALAACVGLLAWWVSHAPW